MTESRPRPTAGGGARPAIVIGGGSAGLATAAALQARGVCALVLEAGDGVGSSWRHRHEELRLNTIRWLSDLPGTPIPRSAGRWVSRDAYVAHLEEFAEHHRLDVRFGVTASRIDRSPDGLVVQSTAGEVDSSDVVVATGHDRLPHVPDWPGRDAFPGALLHAAELPRAADLAGRRVLLVGAGNSGVEMATHLIAAGTTALWVSVRTPATILPLEVAGVPLGPVAVALRWMPERMRDLTALGISRAVLGDLAPYGLPPPGIGPYRRLRTTGVTAAVDRGFARHQRAGRLRVVAQVDRCDGNDVVLRDGTRLRPDVVLLTTGFRPGLEPLVGHLGVLDPAGNPLGRPGTPAPGVPGLWFVGYRVAIEGNLRLHRLEARRIAKAVSRRR